MLWETVAGARMWSKATNDLQILHALTMGRIPRVRDAKPDIDPELEKIIDKATAFSPDDRYATAADFQIAIDERLKALPGSSPSAREFGALLGETFARERQSIKAVIDNQIRTLRGVASGEFSTIDLPQLSASTAPSGTPSGVLLTGAMPPPRPSTTTEAATVASPLAVAAEEPVASKPRRPLVLALGGVAVLVVAVGAWMALRGGSSEARPAASSTPVPVVVAAPPPPASTPTAPASTAAATATAAASSTTDSAPPPSRNEANVPRWQPPTRTTHTSTSDPAPPPPPAPPPATPPAPAATPTATGHAKQQIDTHDAYAN